MSIPSLFSVALDTSCRSWLAFLPQLVSPFRAAKGRDPSASGESVLWSPADRFYATSTLSARDWVACCACFRRCAAGQRSQVQWASASMPQA